MTCTKRAHITHASPARYPDGSSARCDERFRRAYAAQRRALEAALTRERAREEEAVEWFARWHEASGRGDTWADLEAEGAILCRIHHAAWPRGTSIAEVRRAGSLLSGARAAWLRGAARGDLELTWTSCPILPWLEAVARLERAAAIRVAAQSTEAAFVLLRLGNIGDAVTCLTRALRELAEGLERQDEARKRVVETMRRTG